MVASAPREDRIPDGAASLAYWRALGTLPVDRPRALALLEDAFRSGSVPRGLDGPYRGRLIATTFGRVDSAFGALARLWMPWKGKVFDAAGAKGRNILSGSARPAVRAMWPRYRDLVPAAPGRFTTFRFVTETGPSVLFQGVHVLRIDYDISEDPAFIIRRILDELVRVDEDLYLGQALLRLRGRWRRAGWFALER